MNTITNLFEEAVRTLPDTDLTPARLAALHRRATELVYEAGDLAGPCYSMLDAYETRLGPLSDPERVFALFEEFLAEARKLEPKLWAMAL